MSEKNIDPEMLKKINNWLMQPIDEDDKQWILENLNSNPRELEKLFIKI